MPDADASVCSDEEVRYASEVIKRTSLNLDLDLVAKAREALGSNGTTDTIHRALEEVIRREKLRWLANHTFEMTEEEREQAWGD
jgi:Arc/MetJ family transcription regulator